MAKRRTKWFIAIAIFLAVAITAACMIIVFPSKATIDVKNGDVKMIAHRGLSGLHTENTVAAFEAAAKEDYYGIETDVHVTKDGVYVLFHDGDLEDMVGLDLEIEETNYADLKKVKLPDKGGDGEKAQYIPTFEEFLTICKEYNKRAIVELKADFTKEQIGEIVGILETNGMKNNATFISFEEENLLYLREVFPDAPAQYLIEDATEEELNFAIANNFDASIQFLRVLPSKVDKIHAAGLKVGCWTVDKKWQAGLMKKYGVDYITSNILV